ncbi:MAG: UDP-N-acetylglucosamine 2-epimerase (non-hydrolyzing) [Bdellovibrionales bacterium]|nr:UDP-N-acetylglucosamine 2-epimerase (non-hydrolyzing) [Bdellovibrionales bacterium]
MKPLALVMGTRPEIIKLAPLALALRASSVLSPFIIATGQHRSMAEQAFRVFDLVPDLNLDLMLEAQTPSSFLSLLLSRLEPVLSETSPVGVVVQGDTTTTLGGAIAAFHLQLPVIHVEAGLRTHRLDSPFPEEMNRSVVSKIAAIHFTPTEQASKNLQREGIVNDVYMVGNTVVDAVLTVRDKIEHGILGVDPAISRVVEHASKLVLVTGHRRENFSRPLESLCRTILRLRDAVPDLQILYPVHLNPAVSGPVRLLLDHQERIHLTDPVDYPTLVYLLTRSRLVISDSGGIQEEAPSLGTTVLVTRETTERPEAIATGSAILCPLSNPERLFSEAQKVLSHGRPKSNANSNPFGAGDAARKIVQVLETHFGVHA